MPDKISWKWKVAQTLEYKWWQNYLKNRDAENYLEWKHQYWKDLLKSLSDFIELPKGKNILDAGCGPAGIFIALEGNKVDALDPLLHKYKTLQHFQPEKYPYTHFINAPIETLNEKEKYDIIFCMNAINHVNDIESCYDRLERSLKHGGFLVISTDAHRSSFLKKIFQLLPGDMLHPVQFDIKEYDELLLKRNFEILKNQLYKQEKIFDYYITVSKKR